MRQTSRASLERYVLVRTRQAHPQWSLEDLFTFIDSGTPRAAALGKLTIADLWHEPDIGPIDEIEGTTIDRARRRRAQRLTGAAFDQLVLEDLRAAGVAVGVSYLRARLGGPRSKLQDSLGRLIAAGKAMKFGTTSATRYQAGTVQT